MKNIVSREWLIKNMFNDNLIILDACAQLNDPDAGFRQYKEGHIRGARFVSLEKTMTGKISTHGGRHPLPDMEDFIEDMKKLGVQDDSIVVIYDNGDLSMAGRLWWLLRYSGKKDVFILEGGIKGWVDEELEITTELPQVKTSNMLTLNIDDSMEVDIEYVKEAINSEKIAIIDSRESGRYSGDFEPIDRIPGHIPSALNYPWMNVAIDGKIKNIEELKEYFSPLQKYEELIVHCGSGITGTVNILFMEEVGLKPKLYVGGYSDWVSYKDNIVVKKDKELK